MKILFTRFPLESAFGGAEVQTLSLMEGLLERGHAVAFAGSCPVLLSECRKRGIPAVEWHIGPPPVTKWGAISFAWRKQSMKKKLTTLLDQFHDIDCLAMLSLSEKLLLTDTAMKQGTKVFWIEHDRIGRWLSGNPWLPLLKQHANKATTITVSDLSRDLYIDLGWDEKRIITIPNGIDETRLKNAQSSKPMANRFRLGCISRLSHEKGIDVLIEAMAALPDTFMLEISGRGSEEKTLKELIKKLGLNDRITFTSYEPDVMAIYGRLDALVLPSRDNDPFGLAAAEAMFLGLPVVVTDQCGIAGYLKDGEDALIAKADSVSALRDAIKRLPEIATTIGKKGNETARKKFSMKMMVERYEDVFTKDLPPLS